MNVLIVEDELFLAQDLKEDILKIAPTIKIVGVIGSVKELIQFLENQPIIDLIFADIELADGTIFDALQQINTSLPIIFCTAYTSYMLTAFENNGIHYLVKPIQPEKLREALNKFNQLKENFQIQDISFDTSSLLKPKGIIIHHGEYIDFIRIDTIRCMGIQNKIVKIWTHDKQIYFPSETLEKLQSYLSEDFFRINRQYIIHREFIQRMSHSFGRKIKLHTTFEIGEPIYVSRDKIPEFMNWLSGV
ncbi:MAG: LytR/AlgR family response regulator transcription factor [Spirosomataceae bacterium]